MSKLYLLQNGQSRSVSAENPTGAKGAGGAAETGVALRPSLNGGLGKGWKVNPCVKIQPGAVFTLADLAGSGLLTHLWMTVNAKFNRALILRMYWDGETEPSVEVPLGDFFCSGYRAVCLNNSANVTVAPANGLNAYFQMPFRRRAVVTVENCAPCEVMLFYQIDYRLQDIEPDAAYFHASFRRANPTAYKKPFVLVDGIAGRGHYIGTYLAWRTNNRRWWGEGEIKFYLDGDEYPTICGTGTEDYFGGAWNFEYPKGRHCDYSSPYLGFYQANRRRPLTKLGFFWHKNIGGRRIYQKGGRFGLYRWHNLDPVLFERDLRVEIQDLGIGFSNAADRKKNQADGVYDDLKGWRVIGKYLGYNAQQSDIAATCYWYQTEPHAPLHRVTPQELL